MLWLAAGTVAASAEKPAIVVALGLTPDQVQQRSTLRIPWQLMPIGEKQRRGGGTLVNWPHRLIYEDTTLRLALPDAGNHISMPTTIMIGFDVVRLVIASVLGDYVDLRKAVETSKSMLAEILRQGFAYGPLDPEKGQYPKFLLARNNRGAPRIVDSFEQMEQVFLESRYYLEEFVVFVLVKDDLRVSLRVTNMRRRYTEGGISLSAPYKSLDERAAHEAKTLDETSLRQERAYYLEVSIAKRTF